MLVFKSVAPDIIVGLVVVLSLACREESLFVKTVVEQCSEWGQADDSGGETLTMRLGGSCTCGCYC